MRQDFSQRSEQSELMDTESISFEEFHDCLLDLEIINHLTLAYRPTLRWFNSMLADCDTKQPMTVFDIGCGGADMLRQIWKRTRMTHFIFKFIGIDLNPWSKKSAELATTKEAPISVETSNIFSLAPDRRADFIISSLFTHHLKNDELIRFIQWMDHHATRGWFINDLHRHRVAFYFIKYATRIFSQNRLIVHDAPVSVLRAFTAMDWRRLLDEAGISKERTRIEWFFPFRYGISCRKA